MRIDSRTHPAAKHLPVFPRLVVAHLVESGYSEAEIFAGLGFSNQDLERETFRLSAEQHERFIGRAIALTGNLHLPLAMKDHAFEATSNAVLILFATSGRISKALELITRYNPIYTRTITCTLEQSCDGPCLSVVSHLHNPDVSYFAVTSFVLFIDSFFSAALDGEHLVVRAELALHEPRDFDRIRDQFDFDISFDHTRTLIHLDPRLVSKPLRKADPQTTRLITEFCEGQLAEFNGERSVADAVSELVYSHISKSLTLDQAAAKLGLSSRSLRRHLHSAGTTFQSILNEARKSLAIKLLRETGEPVSAIAYQVGFGHPTHFGRAFKRWTGQSPSEFRAQQSVLARYVE